MKNNLTEKEERIRSAFADYVATEGCSCCENTEGHERAMKRLAELLDIPPYPDGSGYDYRFFVSEEYR